MRADSSGSTGPLGHLLAQAERVQNRVQEVQDLPPQGDKGKTSSISIPIPFGELSVDLPPRPHHADSASALNFPEGKPAATGPELEPERQGVARAGRALSSTYRDNAQTRNQGARLGVVSRMSPAQRESALRRISQLDSLNATRSDENRCGAACITAAAFSAGGAEGLSHLIDGIQNFNRSTLPDKSQIDTGPLERIQARLNGDRPLSYDDISHVQDQLYQVLDSWEQVHRNNSDSGLSNRVLSTFLNATPEVAHIFEEQGIGLRAIDNTGDGYSNHFVLMFDGQNQVYDPYPLADGNQLVQDQRVNTYQQAIDPRTGMAFNPF